MASLRTRVATSITLLATFVFVIAITPLSSVPVLALAANLALWLLVLPAPLVINAVVRRKWRRAAYHLVPILGLLFLITPYFVPKGAVEEDEEREIKILTFNLGYGVAETGALLTALDAAKADLMILQEVSAGQFEALKTHFAASHPHAFHDGHDLLAKGILSRYPLKDPTFETKKGFRRPWLRATVLTTNGPLEVVSVHASLDPIVLGRSCQGWTDIEGIAALGESTIPRLIVGDFNMADSTEGWRVLCRRGLRDAWRERGSGLGLTFPVSGRYFRFPTPLLVRIDYVLLAGPLTCTHIEVGPDGGSDHLPVVARLRMGSH